MNATPRHRSWRLLIPGMIMLLVLGGLNIVQPAAAADGFQISDSNTAEPAMGISSTGDRVCSVWTTFDQSPNAAYIRVYTPATGAWSPPLGTSAFQLNTSSPSSTGKAHCAFDALGNLYAVWQECQTCKIAFRILPSGSDAGNAGSWGPVGTVETDRDGPDIDALYGDQNGTVWLVYRLFPGAFEVRSKTVNSGWSSPQRIEADVNAEKVRIGVDNAGFVHLTWRDGNGGVGYSYRDPANGQFTSKTVLSGSNSAGLASLAVDRNTGDVHIVYVKDFTKLYYTKKDGPKGTTFSAQRQIVSGAEQILGPRIAWSATGRLIVVFDNNNKGRIDTILSEDRGANWGSAFQLAKPGGPVQAPWVVADSGGTGYVIYARGSNSSVSFTTIQGTGPVASPSPSPAPNPPLISNVGSIPNTLTSTTINWNTDTASSSRVFFSTVPVDTACTLPSCTAGDAALTTAHSVTLRNLAPATTYNYQVRSTDANGKAALDPTVRTFTTNSLEIVGNGKTVDGKFAALLYVPAGTQKVEWTADSTNFTPISYTTTTKAEVVAFFGDLTAQDPAPARTFGIVVRYNGNAGQVSTTATIQYDPAFKSAFSDVDPNSTSPAAVAIYALQGRGLVQGSAGLFRPLDPIARAEAAAIVARSLTLVPESGASNFSDQGSIDDELWDNVQVLADYGVAKGFGDGTFQPTGNVAQAQIISLITRAMVAKGYWKDQNDDASFPEVPASSGHRIDIVTFNFYTKGALNGLFSGAAYADPAERRFVARIVYETVKYRESGVNGAALYEVP